MLGKRTIGEAITPTHMETVAQPAPSAPARARALVLKGLDKEQRDRIQAADDQLALGSSSWLKLFSTVLLSCTLSAIRSKLHRKEKINVDSKVN